MTSDESASFEITWVPDPAEQQRRAHLAHLLIGALAALAAACLAGTVWGFAVHDASVPLPLCLLGIPLFGWLPAKWALTWMRLPPSSSRAGAAQHAYRSRPREHRLCFDAQGFEGTVPDPVRVAWADVSFVTAGARSIDLPYQVAGEKFLRLLILPRSALDAAQLAQVEAWRAAAAKLPPARG
jgi:hypothetical protein